MLLDDAHYQWFEDDITSGVIRIAEPVDAVLWQDVEFVGALIGYQMAVHLTGVLVFMIGGLGDDRRPAAIELCNQVDGLVGTTGDHDHVGRNLEFGGNHLLQFLGNRSRIMPDGIEMLRQVCLEFRQVCLLVDVGTEVHLYLVAIAIGVVTVSENHNISFFTLTVNVCASKVMPGRSTYPASAPLCASSCGVPMWSSSVISHSLSAT